MPSSVPVSSIPTPLDSPEQLPSPFDSLLDLPNLQMYPQILLSSLLSLHHISAVPTVYHQLIFDARMTNVLLTSFSSYYIMLLPSHSLVGRSICCIGGRW